jgi:response regulator RpfG family c-di-GMP phosphodiesterase
MSKRFREVFIIDDDEIYTMAMKRLFDLTDFCEQVSIFNNGMDARLEIEQRRKSGHQTPDILLVDLNMPIEDGWQFLDACSHSDFFSESNIYLVSSTIDTEEIKKASEREEVMQLLIKPIHQQDLQAIKMSHIDKLIN